MPFVIICEQCKGFFLCFERLDCNVVIAEVGLKIVCDMSTVNRFGTIQTMRTKIKIFIQSNLRRNQVLRSILRDILSSSFEIPDRFTGNVAETFCITFPVHDLPTFTKHTENPHGKMVV